MEKLTEEQRKQVMNVLKWNVIKGLFLGIKYGFFFAVAALATISLNIYYVKSEDFPFPMMLVNSIFLLHFMLNEMKARNAELKAKISKIIDNK